MPIEPGTRIGPYVLSDVLGAGGMGVVYRAHDDRLERDVAIKLTAGVGAGDAAQMRQMQQEARAASRLSHPNILSVYDVGIHEQRMYVVTELLEGESLRSVVERGPMPWRTALRAARQIADGLAAAHAEGIIHRDIKPENLFLTTDDRIKILDFGIATWRSDEGEGITRASARTVSLAGTIVGTVGYMSPEQARGQKVDARSDIFAFGCVLYEMLSGQPAFDGGSPAEVLAAIQRDAPPPLEDLVPRLRPELSRIVERCLEKDPARRFPSARDVAFALSLIETGGPVSGEAVPEAARSPAPSGPGASRPRASGPVASEPVASERRASEPRPSGPLPSGPGAVVADASRSPRVSRRAALYAGLGLGALAADSAATVALQRALAPKPPPAAGPLPAPATDPPPSPLFKQLTFRRGTVYTARFLLDGSIAYSAEWDGAARELFVTLPGTGDARALNQPGTDVAFSTSPGEIGVLRRSAGGFSKATLARLALAGGPSKDLIEGVNWADALPDAHPKDTLVARRAEGRSTLELPAGRTLAEATGIAYPRMSPDGSRVAFLQIDVLGEDRGRVVMVDREGKRLYESASWKSIEGLAWRTPEEIWFTASKDGRSLELFAVRPPAEPRLLLRVPGRLVLHDVSSDGRALAERNNFRCTIYLSGRGKAEARDRDLSWHDFSRLGQLSNDGTQILFTEIGDGAGPGTIAYLRPVSGGPPLRLGRGTALALSDDGREVLVTSDEEEGYLEILPVGAGRPQRLTAGPLASIEWAAFAPAGRVVLLGREREKAPRLYVLDTAGGEPRPLTDHGAQVEGNALSPDGTLVAARLGGRPVFVPLDGGAPREVPGLPDDHQPIGWSRDPKLLFARGGTARAAHIVRHDLAAKRATPWHTRAPPDPAGVLVLGRSSMSRDGESVAYESYRLLSDLYVIENLR